jgi:hypothetical protein
MSKNNGGLEALLRHQLEQKRHGEIIDDQVELYKLAGKEMLSHIKAKEDLECQAENTRKKYASGGDARAKKFQPLKDKFSQIYKSLRAAKQGKKPKLKELIDELERVYPTEDWSKYTFADWYTKLNKGETL